MLENSPLLFIIFMNSYKLPASPRAMNLMVMLNMGVVLNEPEVREGIRERWHIIGQGC